MKYKTPELRYTNARILGEIGFAHLLIATTVLPAIFGIAAMLIATAKVGSAIWMGLQITAIGSAAGVYLSKVRGTLGNYEEQTRREQRDLDYGPLITKLYENPILEFWVLGWGTFAARTWIVLTSAAAASLLGGLSFLWALGIALAIQFSANVLAICLVAAVISGVTLPALPLIGAIGIPNGMSASLFMVSLPALFGVFQKVRHKRHFGEGSPVDQRELASGSGFYIAHEVVDGLLVDALEYGGGYERARDGIKLDIVENQTQMALAENGWKPTVGDLHKGQTVDTAELVSALREAANADSIIHPAAPTLAESLREDAQVAS